MFKQVAAAALAAVVVLGWSSSTRDLRAAQYPSDIWISRATLLALPTSGTAWNGLLQAANKTCGTPDLSNQDDPANVCVMAKALVYARTGQTAYRTSVVSALTAVANAPTYNGRALALGRELGAYVIAADLIDLKNHSPALDNVFRAKLWTLLTTATLQGPVNLIDCHETRPNNWGTHCGASRAAVAAYLGDTAQLDWIARVFKGWLGDRSSYAGFVYGDTSWQCDPNRPVGVNPAGCTKSGYSIDGVLPDDQRRASTFTWPPPQENYVYEALQGAVAQAVILQRAGHDVFNWQNRALLRAFNWLHTQAGYDASGDDTWEPHVINHFYAGAASLPASSPSSPGKNVGWTDWTHQGAATTSTPILQLNPTSLTFSAQQGGAAPASQSVQVTNGGSGTFSWTASVSDSKWNISPASGSAGATISVSPTITGLAAGTYTATLTVTASGVQGSPKTVALTLAVAQSSTSVAVSSLSVSPSSVTGGATSLGTVVLSAKAPSSGATVTLASSSSAASVPATILVPAGSASASFGIATSSVSSSTQATITASLNGSRQAALTVSASSGGTSTAQNLGAEADAFVRGGSYASSNYGGAVDIEVKDAASAGYDRRGFLRFNLASVTSIASAQLRLYVNALPNGAPVPVCAYFVSSDSWSETGITWSNQPGFGASVGCQTVSATGWVTFDLTAVAQQQLSGDKKVSVMLQDSTQANRAAEFRSREASANRPVLEVR